MTEMLLEPEFALPHEAEGGMFFHMQITYAADLWLDELARKGLAEKTRVSYRRILYGMADWMGPTVSIRDVTTLQLRRWFDANAENRKQPGRRKAAGTINQHVTCVNQFFRWLRKADIIKTTPHLQNGELVFGRVRMPNPVDNDNVKTISTSQVRVCLEECRDIDEKLCVFTLGCLGPRRHALAMAQIADYDAEATPRPELTFREKGGKTIAKPVPPELQAVIDEAIAAGVYREQRWLVPNRRPGKAGAVWLTDEERARRTGRADARSDRVIYDLVKKIGDRTGVDLHAHAFRAAFATYFLEGGGDLYDLSLLMGHASVDTTRVYARRLDKKQRMHRGVENFSWGVSPQ